MSVEEGGNYFDISGGQGSFPADDAPVFEVLFEGSEGSDGPNSVHGPAFNEGGIIPALGDEGNNEMEE